MLSKLQKVRQSVSDLTADLTSAVGKKINELQQLPAEIPESWDERSDDHGNPYYVDTDTGEWYRLVDNAKKHKRIDTNEKLSIITAESQKEFDEHKKTIDAEHSDDLVTDEDDDGAAERTDEIHDSIKQTLNNGGYNHNNNTADNATKQIKHSSKRSSTSVSKGWQCEKCTLENKGHDLKCNACLAPRPYRSDDDDEDEEALLAVDEHSDEKDEFVKVDGVTGDEEEDEDADGTRGRSESAHRQMNTIEAIQSAMDASLEALGDDSGIKALSTEQKQKLITFMDFVDTEPDPSIKYLNDANWDIETAVEAYFRQHPDHPKSRGGSLVFDLKQLGDINEDMVDYTQDITLPPDLQPHGQEQGRRGSLELDEVPDGVRSSDNEDNNNNDNSDEAATHDFHMVPGNNMLNGNQVPSDGHTSSDDEDIAYQQTGNRSEHPVYNPALDANNNGNGNDDAYASHNRMDTAQQIAIAEQVSLQQSEFDGQLDKLRKENDALQSRVSQLELENEELRGEKQKFAQQVKEVQDDWEHMSGYMSNILDEVQHIEEERKNGRDVSTPTPRLKAIFEQIEGTLSMASRIQSRIKDKDDESDIYKHVAQLFDENGPASSASNSDGMHLNVDGGNEQQQQHKPRKLSFGLVNELFAQHEPSEFLAQTQTQTQNDGANDNKNDSVAVAGDALSSSSASNSVPSSSFLEVTAQHNDKRLSYGGVGLLFNASTAAASFANENENDNNDEHDDNEDDSQVVDTGNPLNVSFAPSYQGIASLFDEQNDVLGVHAAAQAKTNKRTPSFGGDLVELFTEPNPEWIPNNALSNVDEEVEVEEEEEQEPQLLPQQTVVETTQAQEEEEEDADSMDEQHFYPDADDEDDDDEDEEEDDDDDRFEADKEDDDDDDDDDHTYDASAAVQAWQTWHEQYHQYMKTHPRALPPPPSSLSANQHAPPPPPLPLPESKHTAMETDEAVHQSNLNHPVTNSNMEKEQYVFTTDPETGGLIQVPASSINNPHNAIAATTQQQQYNAQSVLLQQQIQQQIVDIATASMQLQTQAAMYPTLYFDEHANSGRHYYDVLQPSTFSTISAYPQLIHSTPTQAMPSTTTTSSPPERMQVDSNVNGSNTMQVFQQRQKDKKNKKKGIRSSIKWLYIICDEERTCYGSLCRGQFDSITTTQWLTALYEEAEWGGRVVRDRSRNMGDGPSANHIAWYTRAGCNCCVLGGGGDDGEQQVQEAQATMAGFPTWLQQITDTVMKLCGCDAPNCAELFYFENKSSRWNWHSYCEHDIFGLDDDAQQNSNKGQTFHLLIGHRRQFKFAPRKTSIVGGDEEKSIFIENGDIFVTCGHFTRDYLVKIECEESESELKTRTHSSMYIVWRWIVKHNRQCQQYTLV